MPDGPVVGDLDGKAVVFLGNENMRASRKATTR